MLRQGMEWVLFDTHVNFLEVSSAPQTPPANQVKLYAKDKAGVSNLYFKDDAGVEHDLSTGSGGTVTGTGTAGQVAYWSGASALAGSDNLFWDNTNVRLGIRTNAPAVELHVIGADGASLAPLFEAYGTGVDINIRGRHSRGTFASPSAITTDDALLLFSGLGRHNSGFAGAQARIGMYAAESWTSSALGTYINFETTANGTTSRLERGRFLHRGQLRLEEIASDPTTTDLASLSQFTIGMKNNKFVISYNNGGTITYISIPMDGSTTTWTHNTTSP